MTITGFLTDQGLLSSADTSALEEEARTSGTPIEMLLEKRGIDMDAAFGTMSEKYGIPYKKLGGISAAL